jgi:hypothetical protein
VLWVLGCYVLGNVVRGLCIQSVKKTGTYNS